MTQGFVKFFFMAVCLPLFSFANAELFYDQDLSYSFADNFSRKITYNSLSDNRISGPLENYIYIDLKKGKTYI